MQRFIHEKTQPYPKLFRRPAVMLLQYKSPMWMGEFSNSSPVYDMRYSGQTRNFNEYDIQPPPQSFRCNKIYNNIPCRHNQKFCCAGSK